MNFGWVLKNELAGSQGPASVHDLAFLHGQGIRAVIRMEEKPGPPVALFQSPASPILTAAQLLPPEKVATAVKLICAASVAVGFSVALNRRISASSRAHDGTSSNSGHSRVVLSKPSIGPEPLVVQLDLLPVPLPIDMY